MNILLQALRQLRKSPGFTAAAIFSVVEAALLRPLPFPEPDRLASRGEQVHPISGIA